MFVEERQLKILEYIESRKKATVTELRQHFQVSSATIRNDLRELESTNRLIRTHGGAMVRTKTGFELDSRQREIHNHELKSKIAELAIDLIEDGDTILLDTGTTTLELARLLNRRKNLTVVTNDLVIAMLLESVETANVVLMGGILRRHFHCTVLSGIEERERLNGFSVDKAFMGVNSFCLRRGATTPDIHQAQTKKLMIAIAGTVILLCDSTKMGKTSFARFATPEQIDILVTDSVKPADRIGIEEHGIQVILPGAAAEPDDE